MLCSIEDQAFFPNFLVDNTCIIDLVGDEIMAWGSTGPIAQIDKFIYFLKTSNPRGSISSVVLQNHPLELKESDKW